MSSGPLFSARGLFLVQQVVAHDQHINPAVRKCIEGIFRRIHDWLAPHVERRVDYQPISSQFLEILNHGVKVGFFFWSNGRASELLYDGAKIVYR